MLCMSNQTHPSLTISSSLSFCRVLGHSRESLQQVLQGHGWVWSDVLRPGLWHNAGCTRHQVRVQVPLVLCRQVQGMPGDSRLPHLQSTETCRVAGSDLITMSSAVLIWDMRGSAWHFGSCSLAAWLFILVNTLQSTKVDYTSQGTILNHWTCSVNYRIFLFNGGIAI